MHVGAASFVIALNLLSSRSCKITKHVNSSVACLSGFLKKSLPKGWSLPQEHSYLGQFFELTMHWDMTVGRVQENLLRQLQRLAAN